jgi:hypothetical protein
VCAAANEVGGDSGRAAALERAAEDLGIEDARRLGAPRIRLTLARGDLEGVRRVLAETEFEGRITFGLQWLAARLDALAAVRDRERGEQEAPPFLHRGIYLEPFALRALGIVREDEELLGQAQERFGALGLDWHAAQTARLSA